MHERAIAVADYLRKLELVELASPVCVMIGDEQFWGAYYRQNSPYTEGMHAVQLGEKQAGDPHFYNRFYLLGETSKAYQRRAKTAFTWRSQEWYIGAGLTRYIWKRAQGGTMPSVPNAYHPFGEWHDISCWDVPTGEKIDKYELKPYTRIPMTVEFIDESALPHKQETPQG